MRGTAIKNYVINYLFGMLLWHFPCSVEQGKSQNRAGGSQVGKQVCCTGVHPASGFVHSQFGAPFDHLIDFVGPEKKGLWENHVDDVAKATPP